VRAVRGRELRSAIRLQSAKMIGQLCQLCRTSTDTALSSAIRALLKDSALTSNSSPAAGGQLDESHPVVSKILAAVGAKSSISNGGGSSAAASGGGGNKKKVNEEEVPEELNTDLLAGEVNPITFFLFEVWAHVENGWNNLVFFSLFRLSLVIEPANSAAQL